MSQRSMSNERLLASSWGRPRRVVAVGHFDFGGIDGPEVTPLERAPAGTKFDAAVVDLPTSDEEGIETLRVCAARLEDGGHVLIPLPSTFNFAHATMMRSGEPHHRSVDLAKRAGLEVLRIDVGGSLLARHAVVVTRLAPKQRKLSLTVGMLTLNEEESVEKMIDEIRMYAPTRAFCSSIAPPTRPPI